MLIQSHPVSLGWSGREHFFVFASAITIYFSDSSAQVIHNSTTVHKYKKDPILKTKQHCYSLESISGMQRVECKRCINIS